MKILFRAHFIHGIYNFIIYGIFYFILVKKSHCEKDLEAFFRASV